MDVKKAVVITSRQGSDWSMDLLFAVVVGVVIAVLVVLLGRAGKRAEDYPEPSSQDGTSYRGRYSNVPWIRNRHVPYS